MGFIRFRAGVSGCVKATTAIFVIALFAFSPPAWSQQGDTTKSKKTAASANASQLSQQQTGSVTGKVVDQSGTQVVGATVALTRAGTEAVKADATTDEDGRFVFYSVPAGDFELTISFPGLRSQ
jgi:hypothetical protein